MSKARALAVAAVLLALSSCATALKPAPPDAGLDYAMDVSDFRALHIHEARP